MRRQAISVSLSHQCFSFSFSLSFLLPLFLNAMKKCPWMRILKKKLALASRCPCLKPNTQPRKDPDAYYLPTLFLQIYSSPLWAAIEKVTIKHELSWRFIESHNLVLSPEPCQEFAWTSGTEAQICKTHTAHDLRRMFKFSFLKPSWKVKVRYHLVNPPSSQPPALGSGDQMVDE